MLAKIGSDGSYARYRYDAGGRLIGADNAARFLAFDYDPAGRLISE